MDFNKFKKKLQDGVDSAKSKMQQIDTDAFKRQVDEKLCNAKAMAEGLGDSALGLGAKVAEGVGKGIDGLKAQAGKATETVNQAFDAASANVKTALEACGKNMDEFKTGVVDNISDYAKQFSESDLWAKLGDFAMKAGAKLVYIVLCLFYALDTLPVKEKLIVTGALGYFIFPADAVPDLLPGVGLSDDLAALLAVFKGLKSGISPNSVERAQNKLSEWFGDVGGMDLPDVNSISDKQLTAAADYVSDVKNDGLVKALVKNKINKAKSK